MILILEENLSMSWSMFLRYLLPVLGLFCDCDRCEEQFLNRNTCQRIEELLEIDELSGAVLKKWC